MPQVQAGHCIVSQGHGSWDWEELELYHRECYMCDTDNAPATFFILALVDESRLVYPLPPEEGKIKRK